MDKLSLQGFYDFVKAQPANKRINNCSGWWVCAIGDYMVSALTNVKRHEDRMLACEWAESELPLGLHIILGNSQTAPSTYGELAKLVSKYKTAKKTYRVWATQELYASKIIEANSLAEAKKMAERMFVVTGELDPDDINDADCGAILMKDD